MRVPNGLIHHWIATAFTSNATIPQVLAAFRECDRYKDVYHPGVVDSKPISGGGEEDRFSLLLVNKTLSTKKAI